MKEKCLRIGKIIFRKQESPEIPVVTETTIIPISCGWWLSQASLEKILYADFKWKKK